MAHRLSAAGDHVITLGDVVRAGGVLLLLVIVLVALAVFLTKVGNGWKH